MKEFEENLEYYFQKCERLSKKYPLLSVIIGLFLIVMIGSLWSWDALAAIGTVGAVIVSLYLSATNGKHRPHLRIESATCKIVGGDMTVDTHSVPIVFVDGEASVVSINVLLENSGDIKTKIVEAELRLKNGGTVGLATDDDMRINGTELNLIGFTPRTDVTMNPNNYDKFLIVLKDIEGKIYKEGVAIEYDLTMEKFDTY